MESIEVRLGSKSRSVTYATLEAAADRTSPAELLSFLCGFMVISSTDGVLGTGASIGTAYVTYLCGRTAISWCLDCLRAREGCRPCLDKEGNVKEAVNLRYLLCWYKHGSISEKPSDVSADSRAARRAAAEQECKTTQHFNKFYDGYGLMEYAQLLPAILEVAKLFNKTSSASREHAQDFRDLYFTTFRGQETKFKTMFNGRKNSLTAVDFRLFFELLIRISKQTLLESGAKPEELHELGAPAGLPYLAAVCTGGAQFIGEDYESFDGSALALLCWNALEAASVAGASSSTTAPPAPASPVAATSPGSPVATSLGPSPIANAPKIASHNA